MDSVLYTGVQGTQIYFIFGTLQYFFQKRSILSKNNLKVFGIMAIEATKDREIFAEKLAEIDENVAPSAIATYVKVSMETADNQGMLVFCSQKCFYFA